MEEADEVWPPPQECLDGDDVKIACLSYGEALVSISSMTTVMLIIVLGNLLVVVTMYRDSKLRAQRQNWLIVSLAVADLLVGVLVMPLTLINEINGRWTLGNILCEIWLALDVLFVTASILHICAISLDRYWSVTEPLTYPAKRTAGRMHTMIGVSWVVSLLICLPPLFGWHPTRGEGECTVSTELGYVIYSACGSFYIPVIILLIVYARIYAITIRHSRERLKQTKRREQTLTKLTNNNNNNTASVVADHKTDVGCGGGGSGRAVHMEVVVDELLSKDSHDDETTTRCLHVRRALTSVRKTGHWRSSKTSKTCTTSNGRTPPSTPRGQNDGLLKVMENDGNLEATSILLPTGIDIDGQTVMDGRGDVPSSNKITSITVGTTGGSETTAATGDEKLPPLSVADKRRRKLKAKERQATLLLGVILSAFIVSWLPFFLLYVLGPFGWQAPPIVFKIVFWLGYCNSAINPVIYTLFNREFKRGLFRQLHKFRRQCERLRPHRNH